MRTIKGFLGVLVLIDSVSGEEH